MPMSDLARPTEADLVPKSSPEAASSDFMRSVKDFIAGLFCTGSSTNNVSLTLAACFTLLLAFPFDFTDFDTG